MCSSVRQLSVIAGMVFFLLSLSLYAQKGPPPPVHVPLFPQHWIPIPLPAPAISLTEQGSEIWACGEHELIAVSSDGGSTWQVRHLAKSDKLLLTMTFADAQTGYAFGSDGLELRSTDGGASWKQYRKAPGMILHAQFSDSKNGLVASTKWVAFTHDSGATWQTNLVPDIPGTLFHRNDVQSFALLDARHAAVLFASSDQGQGQWLSSTHDGGQIWVSQRFPIRLHLQTLTHNRSGYDLYGCKSVRKGGRCQPIHLVSGDGMNWTTVRQSPPSWNACVQQGCLEGGNRALLWNPRRNIQFPVRPWVVFTWAAGRHGICLINDRLRCAPAMDLTAKNAATPPLKLPAERVDQMPDCLFCPDPDYPQGEERIEGRVVVAGWVNEQGVPEDLTIRSTPTARMAQVSLTAVRHWQFRPAEFRHKPVRAAFWVELDFHSGRSAR